MIGVMFDSLDDTISKPISVHLTNEMTTHTEPKKGGISKESWFKESSGYLPAPPL